MAITAFVVRDVQSLTTVNGPQRSTDTSTPAVESYIVDLVPSPNDGSLTYAQANGSKVTGLGAAIAGITRDGRTYTPVPSGLAFVGLGDEGASTGNAGAKSLAMSGADMTFNVTTGAVGAATEHANAALGVYANGIKVLVTCTITPN